MKELSLIEAANEAQKTGKHFRSLDNDCVFGVGKEGDIRCERDSFGCFTPQFELSDLNAKYAMLDN